MTSNRGVSYGYFNGASWSFTKIEYHSDPQDWQNCYDPLIKVNSSNNPVIEYKFTNSNAPATNYIKVAIKSSSWRITTVQQGSSNYFNIDIFLKSDGTPVVIYLKKNGATDDIIAETYNGSSWSESIVAKAPEIIGGLCAAISSSDIIYIAYEHWNEASTTDKLIMYNNSGGSWSAEELLSSTTLYYYVYKLLLSGGSNVILQYTTQNSSTLAYDNKKFLLNESSGWKSYTMTITPETDNVGITVDSRKNILMVFGNKLATRPRTLSYAVGTYSDPLPVEMNSFSAKTHENAVILTWNTASEINNYGFEIE